ncbi:peptidase C39 family protein [Schaalia suimastitidis]|uniref:peptidase C39 family protein n=1 Tax=Schaalia suimastitidis TaxID=121163 RepID=UPI000415CAFC|nr:peptidase C39 family protein [Schaalia suimastitidis]
MSDTLLVTSREVELKDQATDVLLQAGLPLALAQLWGRSGGVRSARLWVASDHGMDGVGQARPVAYLWEVHRRIGAQRVIVGVYCPEADRTGEVVASDEVAAVRLLIDAVVEEARAAGVLSVKAQVPDDDEVLTPLLQDAAFVELPKAKYCASPAFSGTQWRGWVRFLVAPEHLVRLVNIAPIYERQQSDFTCGPASVIMALSGTDRHVVGGFDEEMAMWREATYTYGCCHAGLAAVIARVQMPTMMRVSATGPLIGLAPPHAMVSTQLRHQIFEAHRALALSSGASEVVGELTLDELIAAVDRGLRVIVLVDLKPLNGEDVPHWVLLWGRVGEYFLLHDPWFDEDFGETWVETAYQAIKAEDMWAVAAWTENAGEERGRVALLLGENLPSSVE